MTINHSITPASDFFSMRGFSKLRLIGAVLVASLFVATSAQAVVSIISDDFEQVDYGTSATSINGLSGGDGWTSGWTIVQGAAEFLPSRNLNYTATGYVNTGSNPNLAGGGAFESNFNAVTRVSRNFSATPVTEGVIWFSYLTNRASVNGIDKRTGITFTRDGDFTSSGERFFTGTRSTNFGIGSSEGFINIDTVSGNTATTTHLILGRIDLENNSFSAWFNPSNLTSIAALGSPHVIDTSRTIDQIDGMLRIYMQETDTLRMSLDSLRVAHGIDSEAGLIAVATAIPEPRTFALIFGFMAFALVAFKRSTTRKG
jgi:hypothetical protein